MAQGSEEMDEEGLCEKFGTGLHLVAVDDEVEIPLAVALIKELMKDLIAESGSYIFQRGHGRYDEIRQFNEDLGKLPHQHKIVVAGNHELTFDKGTRVVDRDIELAISRAEIKHPRDLLTNATHYLEEACVTIAGYKFYGSPFTPRFHNWAYNADRGERIMQRWRKIPSDTDVLITHGPPVGHGDYTWSGVRAGCVDLLNVIEQRVRPRYHIFGHIHEGYGQTSNGTTTFINASTCTVRYKPSNDPIIFDLPKRQKGRPREEQSIPQQSQSSLSTVDDDDTKDVNDVMKN